MPSPRNLTHRLLHFLFTALAGCALLTLLASYIPPTKFWPLLFLSPAYPALFFLQLLFGIIWWFRKKKMLLFSGILFVFTFPMNRVTFQLSIPSDGNPGNPQLSIASFNTNGLQQILDQKIEKKVFTDFIKQTTPDVLCLQEVHEKTNHLLKEIAPYKHAHRIRYKGTMILSNYPIVDQGQLDFDTNTNSCLWADIQFQGKTIRIYSVHLQSNRVSQTTNKLLDSNLEEDQTLSDARFVASRVKRNSLIRVFQAKQLQSHAAKCPHPVIICGDLNETPASYITRILTKGRQDTFRQKGNGIDATYAGAIPGLRIDYILASNRFKVLSHQVYKTNLSDHYPVYSTLEWK